VACVLAAAVLSHAVPAGRYDRRDDPVTARRVVVPGTYHRVEPAPVGAFQALVAIPRGMIDAASVIFYVFLIGGAFTVVEQTGALRRMVDWLVTRVAHREALIIPIACLLFGVAGILIQMQEELLAFVPLLLLITRQLGFDPVTAVAMSLGASAVGAAFSPINPFQVGIAQKVAELPLLSGAGFRMPIMLVALGYWTWETVRHATAARRVPDRPAAAVTRAGAGRETVVLVVVLLTFVVYVYGVLRLGWDFDQLAALMFLMGVISGLAAGLGLERTARGFVDGFASMAYAALLIGFARAIYVVLDQGQIVDTMVQVLFTPLARLPLALSTVGMMAVQTAIHIPVPSTSGQAVLTLPLLVPLSDLLGITRQTTVLAYQYGAGLCELLTPTNGALMAMLAATGVSYEAWMRFMVRRYAVLAGLGVGALLLALGVRLG
jgi:uncharacterized ion transporter superfamily protein YfcC